MDKKGSEAASVEFPDTAW